MQGLRCLLGINSSMYLLMVVALAVDWQQAHASSNMYHPWRECNSQGVYGGLYGAQLLANLTDFRSNLLSKVWSSFDPSVPYLEGHNRFDPMSPFITCPPHQPLVRYGNAADGGKLLCSLQKLQPPCLIYSLGSNGDYSFERDALNSSACDVHTFDCTYNGQSIDKRHTYHKVCVGRGGPLFRTWDEITHMLGHHRGVDVAKIDIEGYEASVLAELRHDVPLPRQVVIELHHRPKDGTATALAAPAPRTPAQMSLLFMHMASLGYGVVAREDNIWGEFGCCAEFTFLLIERQWNGLKVLMHELRATSPRKNGQHAVQISQPSMPPATSIGSAMGQPNVDTGNASSGAAHAAVTP